METKLQVGSVIEVQGWVMLNKLDPGLYRVAKIETIHNQPVYSFSKPKGKKVLVRHYAKNVDLWVCKKDNPDINKIVQLSTDTR